MADIPMGEYRFLTVVSSDNPEAPEPVLEATRFAPSKACQKALFDSEMPIAALLTRQ